MAFLGSICDTETARKSAGSVLMGQNVLGIQAASLSSVAVAQAAAAAADLTLSVCDRYIFARGVERGYQIASNFGAPFSSSYSLLYAALPDSANHQRQMIDS